METIQYCVQPQSTSCWFQRCTAECSVRWKRLIQYIGLEVINIAVHESIINKSQGSVGAEQRVQANKEHGWAASVKYYWCSTHNISNVIMFQHWCNTPGGRKNLFWSQTILKIRTYQLWILFTTKPQTFFKKKKKNPVISSEMCSCNCKLSSGESLAFSMLIHKSGGVWDVFSSLVGSLQVYTAYISSDCKGNSVFVPFRAFLMQVSKMFFGGMQICICFSDVLGWGVR